jgi:enoyl-CoA hydratase
VHSKNIKIIRFFGTKGSFAVGADLKRLQKLTSTDAKYFSIKGNQLFTFIQKSNFISIAEIDGYCMGGGVDFAASCDFRFATTNSCFSHPGVNLGFITGFGGTARISRESNISFAKEFFYTGNIYNAYDLKRASFLCEIFDDCSIMNEKITDFTSSFSNISSEIIGNIKLQFI